MSAPLNPTQKTIQTAQRLLQEGKHSQALKALKKHNNKHPGHAEINRLAGIALIQLNKLTLAKKYLETALKLDPEAIATRLNLASLYKAQKAYKLATETIKAVLEKDPNHTAALFNLANIYRLTEQWDEATHHYQKVLQMAPTHLGTLVTMGLMKKNAGDIQDAIDYFHRALDVDPHNKTVFLALANLKNYTFSASEIETISHIIQQTSDQDAVELLFAKAQYLELKGDHPNAFRYLERANQAQFKKLNRTAVDWADYTQRIKSTFKHTTARNKPASQTSQAPRPLFIVSMPRSGSTLVEQILASHPAVYGASEIATWPQQMHTLETQTGQSFPESWQQTDDSSHSIIAQQYHDKIRAYGAHFQYVSDKHLDNFNYIGAIMAAMPESLIIHCTRHPMDVCLSCYKQLFNDGQAYSYDLKELAEYRKHHDAIMSHWKSLYPEQILTVRYEELIQHTTGEVEKMLAFLDLPWDDACLKFHQTKRVIKTASAAQVTQKIYTNAIHRYKAYGELLNPLAQQLNCD